MLDKRIPDDVIQALSHVTGHLIISWALAESTLEGMVAIIYELADGRSLESSIPRMYHRKIKFLRRCFNQIEGLKPLRIEALDLLDRSKPIAKLRNDITHGALSQFNPQNLSVMFVRIDIDETADIHVARERWLRLEDIVEASGKCGQLTIELHAFALRLADHVLPDDVQN